MMALSNDNSRDLILDGKTDVEVKGFRAVEIWPQGKWRWAFGARQSITFPALPGNHRLSYRIHLFHPDVTIAITVVGQLPIKLIPSRAKEMHAGSINFIHSDANAPIEITFSAEFLAGKELGDLCFAVHSFHHFYEMSAEGTNADATGDLPEDPAILLETRIPDFFCAHPFTALFLNQEGKTYPCCLSQMSSNGFSSETIPTDEATPATHSACTWNSPVLRSVRKQMVKGIRPSSCAQCIQLEDAGIKSLRQEYNEARLDQALIKAKRMNRAGDLTSSPLILDIQQGNQCNLKCRMCTPVNSVGLIKEHSEIYGEDLEYLRENFWLGNSHMSEKLIEFATEVDELAWIGGEPFVTKEYLTLLQGFINRQRSQFITLRLNTNLTVLSENVRAAFQEFQGVRLQVSLDGFGMVNDFIRFPSKFSLIEKNLKTLHENMEHWNLTEVSFNTTVQIYNIFEIADLFEYLEANYPRFHWFPHLSILNEPEAFSINVLPTESRIEALHRLQQYMKSVDSNRNFENASVTKELIREKINSLILYLNQAGNTKLLPEFFRRHEIFDRHRNQSIPYAIPGLIHSNHLASPLNSSL